MNRLFLLIFSFFLLSTPGVYAQEATTQNAIEQADTVYTNQFEVYRQARDTYIAKKTDLSATGSLVSEQDALFAAKAAASARANVFIAYARLLRIKLSALSLTYPEVNPSIAKLDVLISWFQAEISHIATADTIGNFDNLMNQYIDFTPRRDQTFAAAQISLKLAELANIQHQARALYDPLLADLQPKSKIAEVSQGMARVTATAEDINSLITETDSIIGSLEAGNLVVKNVFQKVIPALDTIRSKQLQLIDYLIELEKRYNGS